MHIFCLLLVLFLLQSCGQDPAIILLKGENYYGRDNNLSGTKHDAYNAKKDKQHAPFGRIKVQDLSK
ncbi:hypothetical protein RLOatenuis_7170 [Rickettsiales bacterium]|nr:hypothetical protein RLOatenuis_7170 [Rickettsiales bacterium]